MAFDELIADRIQQSLNKKHIPYEAKKMMGGLCYLVNEKMCLGIIKIN